MLWMAVLLCGLFNLSLSLWCFSSLQNEDNNFIVTESWRAGGRESTLQPWNTMPQQGPLFQVGFLNLPESDDLMPLNHTLKHSLNGTFWVCSTTIKKKSLSHKGLLRHHHGPGPGMAEAETRSQFLFGCLSLSAKSRGSEQAPPAWAPATTSPLTSLKPLIFSNSSAFGLLLY